jgi:hypothetical protein
MGKRPQRVTTLTYSPRNWWAVAPVASSPAQLLFKVAVEEIGALDGQQILKTWDVS